MWLRTALKLGGLALWLAATSARAQESPRRIDVNGWGPPAVPRTLHVHKEAGGTGFPACDAKTPSNSYVNPTTGTVVPVPPPPPLIPSDEWTPAMGALGVRRTSLQQQKPMDVRSPTEEGEVQIQLEPPGPDRIFGRRDSELSLKVRMQQEVRSQKRQPVDFPDEPILSTQKYAGRVFPPMTETVEPNYLCYGRLYFEDKNSERYGWDLGFVQPFVSGGIFLWDTATLPYRLATDPCRRYECNSGYCMPGDPVPYLLYPPEWSVTGMAAEIGTIIALAAIFPA